MFPADTNASNQHQDEGSRGPSQITLPYTLSETVRSSSASEHPCELYTRKLLDVNLGAQDNYEGSTTTNLTKKYWSLEELKLFMSNEEHCGI
ncbi:uncharacterized protein BDW43DRAFT_288932 [Aspergillus alliaceus]|uniref:uncharacterized protein n=1 Tax=Petromyces alliaceus TaxID=209559 RepID=UPI0012A74885|nr:uncharacterized protein BDW43DRAFT_288932 [Aspergillus alliaceus]KAB8229191.1 hypothetical protein BDW43DRAFT_288932 [Aspergillus alliaceus]